MIAITHSEGSSLVFIRTEGRGQTVDSHVGKIIQKLESPR